MQWSNNFLLNQLEIVPGVAGNPQKSIFFVVCFEGVCSSDMGRKVRLQNMYVLLLLLLVVSYGPSAQGERGHLTQVNKGKSDPA